ncbi:hypothetical protein GF385_03590 [Candidatus Dependentiae bacterium]|nr:hypothetical protein [Candidatus Dependentiae bacterium]
MLLKRNILLCVVFTNLVFAKSFSKLSDIPNLSYVSKEEILYYQNNKWDFIKKEFVEKINSMSKDNSFKVLGGFTFFCGLVLILAKKFESNDKMLIYSFRVLFSISGIFSILSWLSKDYFLEIHEQENLLKVMDNFFKNYSTDLNSNLEINYRKFVPAQLLPTFDAIYDSYKKEGSSCLEFFIDIMNSIRNKFVLSIEKSKA